MDIETLTPLQWVENEGMFSNQLENQTVRDKIPLLNVNKVEHFKHLTLVRFYGMIQDMHSPEYYLEKFEVINKNTNQNSWVVNKYNERITLQDNEYINFENSSNITSERQTFVVISVPAVNGWVQTLDNRFKKAISKSLGTGSISNKRPNETMDLEAGPSEVQKVEKKMCIETTKLTKIKPDLTNFNNPKDIYPLPLEDNQVFHIKIYKDQDKLKINDVCEFIGFLDTQPLSVPEITDDSMEIDAPVSLYPRIHCIAFSKMRHNNPLLDGESINRENINMIRKDLLIVLTQLLLGDELAAEYLLYNLISEIYLRRDTMALGKFSLNISNIPTISNISYQQELYKFIEKFVPKSLYLPLTLENLNDLTFVPKKNYDLNYLSSGILQLSNNTHVVLDETKLSEGKLNEVGLNNVKALSSCIKHQIVGYDFKFYSLDFNCDIPFLILSQGKSMIHSDVHVVLLPDSMCLNNFKEILQAASHFLNPQLLDNIRKYLTLTRMSEYTLTEKSEEFVQNEFVKMRQDKNVTGDDLHNMLILARLVSISEGKSNLCEESWKKAFEMEEKRKSRIKN